MNSDTSLKLNEYITYTNEVYTMHAVQFPSKPSYTINNATVTAWPAAQSSANSGKSQICSPYMVPQTYLDVTVTCLELLELLCF